MNLITAASAWDFGWDALVAIDTRGTDSFVSLEHAFGVENFSVVVAYADLAGGQLTTSRFDVYHRAQPPFSDWDVRQVHF